MDLLHLYKGNGGSERSFRPQFCRPFFFGNKLPAWPSWGGYDNWFHFHPLPCLLSRRAVLEKAWLRWTFPLLHNHHAELRLQVPIGTPKHRRAPTIRRLCSIPWKFTMSFLHHWVRTLWGSDSEHVQKGGVANGVGPIGWDLRTAWKVEDILGSWLLHTDREQSRAFIFLKLGSSKVEWEAGLPVPSIWALIVNN